MKKIALSMRVDVIENRSEIRDSIDQKLINFLSQSGFQSNLIPNQIFEDSTNSKKSLDNLYMWLNSIGVQGIVLSGGNNIGQFPQRDKTEYALLNYAFKKQIPVLGICRGMQVLANWSGVGLISIEGRIGNRIDLNGEINQNVNCYYEFVIANCPLNFKILARCNQGTIQAISHLKLPWEGWMWHPERESPFKQYDINRFKQLFN